MTMKGRVLRFTAMALLGVVVQAAVAPAQAEDTGLVADAPA